MKKTIILSAAALTLILAACNSSKKNEQTNSADSSAIKTADTLQTFNLDTTALKSGEKFYQCEMNPEVLSDKAGTCPKCGMELTEMKKQ